MGEGHRPRITLYENVIDKLRLDSPARNLTFTTLTDCFNGVGCFLTAIKAQALSSFETFYAAPYS